MIHDNLMSMILDSLRNNVIIKDKYHLEINYSNSSLSAYKYSENAKFLYKVIQKDTLHKDVVLLNKKDFEKYDYFIVIPSHLDYTVYNYKNLTCRIVFKDTLKVNFNNGFFDMCNGYYSITDDFVEKCEELTSILL